jgi:hypothetical protein
MSMSMTNTSSQAKSRDPGGLLSVSLPDSFTPLRFAQNDRAL